MRKSILALVLAICVFMTFGCKKPPVPGPSSSVSSEVVMKEKITNLGGYEFSIASIWGGLIFPEEGASAKGDKLREIYKSIEKDYNCTIEVISVDPSVIITDITNAISSGDKYADVFHLSPYYYYPLVASSFLEPINNLKDISVKDKKWFKPNTKIGEFGGKNYTLSWTDEPMGFQLRSCMFFNKEIMTKYNQPNIYDMVKKGTWTWDAFKNICLDIQKQSSGSVKGIGAMNTASLIAPWIASNNSSGTKEENGKFVFKGAEKNAIDAMQYAQDLILKDKIWKEPAEGDWLKASPQDFMLGQIAFYTHNYYMSHVYFNSSMTDDYGIIPFPKGPQAKDYVGYFAEAAFYSFASGNPDVQKAATIMNAIATRTATDWKKQELEKSLRDEESLEMIELMINNPVIDVSGMVPAVSGPLLNEYMLIGKGEKTPKQAMSGIGASIQAMLDDTFKK